MPGYKATAPQSFRFSRLNRLLQPADFQRVFRQAARSSDRYYTVLWQQNFDSSPRIGFAIAKKRIAHAVVRNRLRRIARESFRQNFVELGSVDIVILAQSAAATASNQELFRSLANHWRKITATTNKQNSKITGTKAPQGPNLDG